MLNALHNAVARCFCLFGSMGERNGGDVWEKGKDGRRRVREKEEREEREREVMGGDRNPALTGCL